MTGVAGLWNGWTHAETAINFYKESEVCVRGGKAEGRVGVLE